MSYHPDLFGAEYEAPARKSSLMSEFKVVSVREAPAPESLLACETPEDARHYWERFVTTGPCFDAALECIVVLILNTRLRVKGHHVVTIGTINECMARPAEILRMACITSAYAIVMMHNHPSGDSTPSTADRSLTRRLNEGCTLLQIRLFDHVIVGHDRHFSFREAGML